MITIKITGAEQIEQKLATLPQKMAVRVLDKSARAGCNVVLHQARRNAKSLVRGSMGSLIAKYIKTGKPARRYQPRHGVSMQVYISALGNPYFVDERSGKRAYIPFALEYGHAGPGDAGGAKVARPIGYLRKAWLSKRMDALSTFTRTAKVELPKVVL